MWAGRTLTASTLWSLFTHTPCRDISERALRVLRKEAEKYSEVRSRLATVDGLQAAALFQEGLKQATPPGHSPAAGAPHHTTFTFTAVCAYLWLSCQRASCLVGSSATLYECSRILLYMLHLV